MLQILGHTTPLTFRHRPFGLKKHWATNLHYDLRLEWNGRLLSWAMPMGPTRNLGIERKAIQMPDHSPDNLDFEGVHRTGTIMFWDRGTWELLPECEDVDRSLESGILRFRLHGEKLEGGWTLRRTNEDQHGSPIWLLTKDEDFASVGDADYLLEEHPNSVKTGRTREKIESDWIEAETGSDDQTRLF
jgi:bifunctional non-homologous end joining protein LigD